jgi:hypothetical protein
VDADEVFVFVLTDPDAKAIGGCGSEICAGPSLSGPAAPLKRHHVYRIGARES